MKPVVEGPWRFTSRNHVIVRMLELNPTRHATIKERTTESSQVSRNVQVVFGGRACAFRIEQEKVASTTRREYSKWPHKKTREASKRQPVC